MSLIIIGINFNILFGVNDADEPVMGVFAKRSHRIIPTSDCKIQNQKCQKVANDIFRFIKEKGISRI